jgi:hypothetical protein
MTTELEFYDSNHEGGLVAPSRFCSRIGGLLPIDPWVHFRSRAARRSNYSNADLSWI